MDIVLYLAGIAGRSLAPLSFLFAFVGCLMIRRWWFVPVVGLAVALIGEFIIYGTQIQFEYVWGQSFHIGLPASIVQAAVAFVIITLFRKSRRGG